MRAINRSSRAEILSRKLWTQDLKNQARHYLGSDSDRDILKAEKKIEKLGKNKVSPLSVEKFFTELCQYENIFLAEFHGVRQSQRSHLRILKKLLKKTKSAVVACEFFRVSDAKAISRFSKGEITEAQFLQQVQWQKNWQFPWEFYRPLVRWLIDHSIPFFGVSRASNRHKSLDECDKNVVTELKKLKNRWGGRKLVVIYGSLHMRPEGLPEMLGVVGQNAAVVYQNIEPLYFNLLEKGLEDNIDVVGISRGRYCLVDIPPWVLWQNFLFQMEKRGDLILSDEIDLNDQAAKIGSLLSSATGLKLNASRISVTPEWTDTHFLKDLKSKLGYPTFLVDEFKRSGGAYLPEKDLIFISKLSVNVLASHVMAMLICQSLHLDKWDLDPQKDFEAYIWYFGWQYFGSKMINPKRKSQSVDELRKAMGAAKSRERLVLRLAVAQKAFELQGGVGLSLRPKLKANECLLSARMLGNLFGENLFRKYRGTHGSQIIKALLSRDFRKKTFRDFYYEIMEEFASLQEPQRERL